MVSSLVLAACGGSVNTTSGTAGTGGNDNAGGEGGSGTGGTGGIHSGGSGGVIIGGGGRSMGGAVNGGAAGAVTHQPLKHRSVATPCQAAPGPAPPPPLPGDAGIPAGQCTIDADCRGGVNGRCVRSQVTYCTYDACFSDRDCAADQLCECGGSAPDKQGPTRPSNACLSSGCRVDADCPGSWCSPTFGTCGNFSGVIGYQCHTPSDQCTDDADCGGTGTFGTPYCMYDPMVGHWLCSNSQCVG